MSSESEPVTSPDEQVRPRSSYRLMFAPLFGPFFWATVCSTLGVWIHNVVAAVVAYQLSGSTIVVGAVTAAQFIPNLLFAPLSGKGADRGNPVLQIAVGRVLTAVGSGGLAVFIWLSGGTDQLQDASSVVIASLVVGVGFVIGGPATQSIVPSMIKPPEMAAAMALNSVPMTLARAGGPVLGAVIATQLGAVAAFSIASVSHVVYALVIISLRLPRRPKPESEADHSVRAAMRFLRTDRPLVVLLLGIAAVGVGADPSITLAPGLAHLLGGGAGLVGWLSSTFGLGAALGFVVFARAHAALGLEWLCSVGLLLMALGLGVSATGFNAVVALVGFGLSGAGMTLAFTGVTTLIQKRSPDGLRGRIMSLWFLGWLGARPFAAAMNGALADALDVKVAFAATGLLVTIAAYLCRPSQLRTPGPHSSREDTPEAGEAAVAHPSRGSRRARRATSRHAMRARTRSAGVHRRRA